MTGPNVSVILRFYSSQIGPLVIVTIQDERTKLKIQCCSGDSGTRPPSGKEILASIERCPYLRGRFVLKRLLWDITMWPF